jgi:BirA family biotin operon repressor/biotin-[acetyl-CoA-carboxylase] ligase
MGDVLQSFGIKTAYKWPNDLMLDGKKLAGILLEKKNINHAQVLVIGVGLNLVSSPTYATSLQNFKISREEILEKFCQNFAKIEAEYQNFGFTFLRNKWLRNCYKLKEKVALSNGLSGVFNGIDEAGNLLLLDENGLVQKIAVAEILP